MAKVYGDRWEVLRSLGEGGQAYVYLVKDTRGQFQREMALKHLRNIKRRDRFINEAKAGLRLAHPNIVRVVDHSTLGDDFDEKDRQYLVMPYARGGSLAKRASLYKGSLDSTLLVAERLASALEHAHANGVIHRDLKPENVLFNGEDHECLLADFGICLLQDESRSTETGEVVGPREFMAPELGGGGQLDVTPAADLYSLGKVMYFMYSGGVVVPRERQREKTYASVWSENGIRSESVGALLDRLICPLERRIQKASDVLAEIRRIRELDRRPGVSPVAPQVAALVASLAAGQQEARSIDEHNRAIAKSQQDRLARYCDSISKWLLAELRTQAKMLTVPGSVEVTVESIADADALAQRFTKLHQRFYAHVAAILKVQLLGPGFSRNHALLVLICRQNGQPMGRWTGSARLQDADIQVSLVPYYIMDDGRHTHGFLGRVSRPKNVPAIQQTFFEEACICHETTVEKWPTDQHEYKAALDEAFQVFFGFVKQTQSGSYGIGR